MYSKSEKKRKRKGQGSVKESTIDTDILNPITEARSLICSLILY